MYIVVTHIMKMTTTCYYPNLIFAGSMFHFNKSSSVWNSAGCTMSEKSAIKEFPCLTKEIIYEALKEGKLEGRHQSYMGNSYVKLITTQVRSLVMEKFGLDYFAKQQSKKRLLTVRKELKTIPEEINKLQERQKRLEEEEAKIVEGLGNDAPPKSGRGRARGRGRGLSAARGKAIDTTSTNDGEDKENTPAVESDGSGDEYQPIVGKGKKTFRGRGRGGSKRGRGRGGSKRGRVTD